VFQRCRVSLPVLDQRIWQWHRRWGRSMPGLGKVIYFRWPVRSSGVKLSFHTANTTSAITECDGSKILLRYSSLDPFSLVDTIKPSLRLGSVSQWVTGRSPIATRQLFQLILISTATQPSGSFVLYYKFSVGELVCLIVGWHWLLSYKMASVPILKVGSGSH
jgi:hypothetical protein